MKLPSGRRQRDSHAEAGETLRNGTAWREALDRWRPVRGSDEARAELDHAVRRFAVQAAAVKVRVVRSTCQSARTTSASMST